ncbi:MAG: trypsin-like peptidase domain-containing protein [Hyphomicrobiales bacterium]|nr:trypsin-like peptidase domain-containing protein [Hyphomicrobiales bacterium]
MFTPARIVLITAYLLLGLFLQQLPMFVATANAKDCDKHLSVIYDEISPFVVVVSSLAIDPFVLANRVTPSTGSGLVIDSNGTIVTNYHVVAESRAISVALKNGKAYPAGFVGGDPLLDLAVLRVRTSVPLPQAPRFADSDKVRMGDEVIAIGNPFGISQTLTRGVVSGLNRFLPITSASWLTPFIQTDAAINPGNSGGPLINKCGEVVGINTLASTKGENLGFAIPSNVVKEAVNELLKNGRIIRAWHGIYGRMVDVQALSFLNIPLTLGYLVETIEPGSAAERAGLIAGSVPVRIGAQEFVLGGDIITRVNETPLVDIETVMKVVNALKVGQKVKVEYFRDGQTHSVKIVLSERPILQGDLRRMRKP